jgi:hypothetical protein
MGGVQHCLPRPNHVEITASAGLEPRVFFRPPDWSRGSARDRQNTAQTRRRGRVWALPLVDARGRRITASRGDAALPGRPRGLPGAPAESRWASRYPRYGFHRVEWVSTDYDDTPDAALLPSGLLAAACSARARPRPPLRSVVSSAPARRASTPPVYSRTDGMEIDPPPPRPAAGAPPRLSPLTGPHRGTWRDPDERDFTGCRGVTCARGNDFRPLFERV